MDIYSLYRSMDQVIEPLESETADGGHGERAALARDVRDLYAPLYYFRPEPTDYGKAVFYGAVPSQASNVARVVQALRRELERRVAGSNGNPVSESQLWEALESARVTAASESYYRQLPETRERRNDSVTLWNVREAAMFRALQSLRASLQRQKEEREHPSLLPAPPPKIVVWAHNSHVGDVRGTQRSREPPRSGGGPSPLVSLGQLCRNVIGPDKVFSVGFTANSGTVRASRAWGDLDVVFRLRAAADGSHERLLGELARRLRRNVAGYCFRSLGDGEDDAGELLDAAARELFSAPRIQRLVGTTYSPEAELRSHYETATLSDEFDYVFHVDRSTAVRVDEAWKWKQDSTSAGARHSESQRRPMYLLDAYGTD
jgi:erythromycin esterase-like protein